MIEKLIKDEVKDVYKTLIKPILEGDTIKIYPTDNYYTRWANLQDNIEVFNRSAKGIQLEHGLSVADRVQKVIDELIASNSLVIK